MALADDADALFWNPAGLVQISGGEFSAFFSRPFGIEEMAFGSAGYVQPTSWGRWGLSLKTFGNAVYRENTVGLSYGRAIWKGLFAGATAKVFSLRIDRYGSALAYGIDIGCLIEVSDGVYGGLCITNINGPHLGEDGERLPRQISFGLRGNPVDELILSAELQKETAYGMQFHAGQEYRISKSVALRAGVSTDPADFTAGAGFYFGRYRFDYAFSSHPVLGMTHQASITIHLGTPFESPDNGREAPRTAP